MNRKTRAQERRAKLLEELSRSMHAYYKYARRDKVSQIEAAKGALHHAERLCHHYLADKPQEKTLILSIREEVLSKYRAEKNKIFERASK